MRSPRLDPGAAKALAIADTWQLPEIGELAIAEIRANMRDQLALAAPPAPVAEVSQFTIPRPDGSEIAIRLYRSDEDGAAERGLLYAHGGGWAVGSLDNVDGLCRGLANAGAGTVLSVEYRLAPEDRHPAGLHDLLTAFEWAESNCVLPAAGRSRLAVGGDSAGGNLSAALCLARRQRGLPQPAGQLLLYPAVDPACDTASHRENGEDYFITREAVRWLWGQYVNGDEELGDELVAPLRARSLAGLAPCLVVTAEFDPLRDEGERYAELLRAAGVAAEARRYDGLIHGFLTWDRYIERVPAIVAELGEWLRGLHPA